MKVVAINLNDTLSSVISSNNVHRSKLKLQYNYTRQKAHDSNMI